MLAAAAAAVLAAAAAVLAAAVAAALVVAARVSDQHPLRTQAPSRIDDGTKTVAEEIDVAGGADEVGPAAARAGE